jgi:hypothetical protein
MEGSMRGLVQFAAVCALVISVPAWAAEQPATNPNDPNEVICKQTVGDTGSRLSKRRECHTRREWEERRARDRQMTEDAQMRDSRGVSPP